jgi:sigma-54 dependent transcriptional regulator, acetoin dehydrogenase operon transcriptional activator AcoR
MSLEHLELRREHGRWMARDLGSKNGVLVDGVRLPQAEVDDGSMLQLGHTLFSFRDELPQAEPATLDFGELLGGIQPLSTMSAAFATVLERAAAVAPSRVPVLLSGESGTGKEVLARHIHALSGRKGALVAVNSGAIPPNLVEAELFGHKKGAFSGAIRDRPGLLRASNGGTLFLDEIGDLPLPAQAALLRVLQEAEVLPVGSHRPESLDLRAIAATHHDLKQSVREGRFRHDLLARLEGITLSLPALRDRPEDISLLLVLLLRKLAPERSDVKLTPAAAQALLSHSWPLNVRELEQALAGALALSGVGPIDVSHLPPTVVEGAELPPKEPARELTPDDIRRREELIGLLREHRGNLSAVARAVGKGRTQVGRWIARYRIDVRSLRS